MAYVDVGVYHSSASSEMARARIYPSSSQLSRIKTCDETKDAHGRFVESFFWGGALPAVA